MRQGVALLLVALLAGGVAGHAGSGSREPAASATPSPPQPSANEPSDERCPGPREKILAFLETRGAAPATRDPEVSATLRAENVSAELRVMPATRQETSPSGGSSKDKGDKVETLIATVPDPVASGLDYQFDLTVDAIQAAAGAVQYSLVTSWLPWGGRDRPEDSKSAAVECARHHPGVLIFRTAKYVLLIFLVGETPTAGVHAGALEEAIHLVDEFQHGGGEILRVLGPSYSGSAIPLSRVLARHRKGKDASHEVRFRIVTGSASVEGIGAILRAAPETKAEPVCTGGVAVLASQKEPAPSDQFQRTIHTHEALREAAEKHLTDLGMSCEQITYLVESSTFFGVRGGRPGDAAAADAPAKSTRVCDPESKMGPRRIVFPLHVSDVRRALDRDRDRRGNVEIAGYELPRTLLGLREDSSSASGDLVPAFSATSSNHEEMALATEIASACADHSRAFGIEATDARDKRFLIERVRALCPRALVFTFQGDLLFAYPDTSSHVGGTLIFSSYPLFHLYGSEGDPSKRTERVPTVNATLYTRGSATPPLSDAVATGIYNAAIVHLDEMYHRHPDSACKPHDLNELIDYQCPSFTNGTPASVVEHGPSTERSDSRHPPIWISIAGRNQILPMRAICEQRGDPSGRPSGETKGSMYMAPAVPDPKPPPPTSPPRAPAGTRTLTLLLAAYCSWLAYRCWPGRGCSRTGWAAVHLAFATLALLVFIVLTSAPPPPFTPFTWSRLGFLSLRFGTRVAAGFVLLATAAVLVAHGRPAAAIAKAPAGAGAARYWLAVVLAAAALGVTMDRLAAAAYALTSKRNELFFLAVRAMNLASGVSPLLPLLLLALAGHLLISLQLRRTSLLGARFTEAGIFAGLLGSSSETVAWGDGQLRWIVRGGWRSPLRMIAGLGFVASVVVVLPWTPTAEGSWFDGLFRAGFVGVAVGITVCCARAALGWRALRTVLRRVARHPLQHAIRMLPRIAPHERFANLLSMRPTVRELELSQALAARCATGAEIEAAAASVAAEISRLGVGPLADRRGPWCTEAFGIHQRIAERLAQRPDVKDRWRTLEPIDEERPPSAEELLIARQFELGVAWIVTHLRELLSVTVSGAILLAMATAVYPFPAPRLLQLAVWVIVAVAALTTVWIVYAFERTEVAVWMADAPPDQVVNWKLAGRVAMLCIVPVLAVIAIQFPDSAAWLARLFDPFVALAR